MGPANVVDCVRYDNEDAMRGFSLGGRKAPTESSIQSGRCKVRHYFRRKLRQSPRHEWGVRHRAGIEDNNYSLAACDPTLFSVLTVLEGLVVELRGSVRGRSTAGRRDPGYASGLRPHKSPDENLLLKELTLVVGGVGAGT